ncbi:MAG: thermonuclease family protein [Patescibacteria group bacterium]
MKKRINIGLFIYIAVIVAFATVGLIRYKISRQYEFKASPIPVVSHTASSEAILIKVLSVIDGDTIIIEGNQKVRYIGIDTPETKDPRKEVECYGHEAYVKNKELVNNKYVRLEKDISDTDRYGRLLRYVWVYDSSSATGSGLFVNEELVRGGYARTATFPPDVKYSDRFKTLQETARKENKGLWTVCRIE